MKNILPPIVALVIATNFSPATAQTTSSAGTDTLNQQMLKVVKTESQPGFLKFKDEVKINPETIFSEYKSAFELQDDDNMVLQKTEQDELGFTHFQYQQYYKNIRIDGAIFKVHSNRAGTAYAANGKIVSGLKLNTTPAISASSAIDAALTYVNAKEYKWQSEFWQNELRERTGKPDTSYYPVPELVIREMNTHESTGRTALKPRFLAYRLDIYTSSPNFSQRLFIDAQTGKVLEVFPLQSTN